MKALTTESQEDLLPVEYPNLPSSSPSFVLNPLTLNSTSYSNYAPSTMTAAADMNTSSTPSPAQFPLMRSAWSDSVLPIHHTHSLSTASIDTITPNSCKCARASTVSGVVMGRMNRPSPLGGSFTNPLQYPYVSATLEPAAESIDNIPLSLYPLSAPLPNVTRELTPTEEDGEDDEENEDSNDCHLNTHPPVCCRPYIARICINILFVV
jgi:hypothetical protein